jgi:hypothetical protein
MHALVFSGHSKNEQLMKLAIEGEKFIAHNFKKIEGCKGGMFLYKDDGSFLDISLWEKKEDAEKMLQNPIVKGLEKTFEGAFTDGLKQEYYEVGVATEIAAV